METPDKSCRMKWAGHVLRMNPELLAVTVFQTVPKGRKTRGGQRSSWRLEAGGRKWKAI